MPTILYDCTLFTHLIRYKRFSDRSRDCFLICCCCCDNLLKYLWIVEKKAEMTNENSAWKSISMDKEPFHWQMRRISVPSVSFDSVLQLHSVTSVGNWQKHILSFFFLMSLKWHNFPFYTNNFAFSLERENFPEITRFISLLNKIN